jgi:periplasmic protein TonB
MFEDSTFESAGRLHTRSRRWMIATFVLNAAILLALILIPLFYPEALTGKAMTWLMTTPPVPVEQPKPVARPEHATPASPSEMRGSAVMAPRQIPTIIYVPDQQGPPASPSNVASMIGDNGPAGTGGVLRGGGGTGPVVVQAGPKTIPSVLAEGLLIHRVVPQYPAIPRTIRLEGTVVLQATISKSGTIENLRVVSGPPMLQQAALDAVAQWRYRPYLLNGQPIEVETTVNVEFKLQ